MSKPLKLAIAGMGLVGKRHAKVIEQLDEATLVANIDPNFSDTGDTPLYSDLLEAVKGKEIDGVILATPTPLHVEQARICIEHGIPTLIEKPIAVSADAALPVVELADIHNVPLLIGHHRRHNPINQKAHEIITNGGIGIPRAAHINCWFYKPTHYFDQAPWRKKKGAGPISVNLVHDVDLIRYFFGEVVSVQAQSSPSERGYENEDVAVAILRFESGALATITVSDAITSPWSWELTSGEYPIYPKTAENCYLLGGSKGSLSIPNLKLWHHEKTPDWWSPIEAMQETCETSDPLINQMRHFCDVIEGKAEPLVSGYEGLKTLRVIEAIQQSATTNLAVNIINNHLSNPSDIKSA